MKITVVALVALAFALADAYVNYYDESANMDCPEGQYMYHIQSIHSNRHEDRRWDFRCRSESLGNCSWTGYVNELDGLLAYICPGNKVVCGIQSYHSNRQEDRRFKFKCCDVAGKITSNCYFTDFVNNWDRQLTVNAPNGQIIKGAASNHDNMKEDRRWKFLQCSLQ